MSTTVGSLKANWTYPLPGSARQIAKVGQQFGKMKSQIVGSLNQIHPALGTLTNALTGPGGIIAAGLATATGIGFAFKRLMTESESIESVADRLNMGTEFFERLQHAAFRTDTSFGTVTSAWQKMQIEISKASSGGGKADFYKQLGLDAASLAAGSPEQAFTSIAGAIAQIENPVQRARMEYELFGRSGVELEGVLRMTAAGLGDIAVVSEESRKKMALLENKWLDFKNKVGVAAKEILIGAVGWMVNAEDSVASAIKSQPLVDPEQLNNEKERGKVINSLAESIRKLKYGEEAYAELKYKQAGAGAEEMAQFRRLIGEQARLKELRDKETKAATEVRQEEERRVNVVKQLREEVEKLRVGEKEYALRGLEGAARQEAAFLMGERDRLTQLKATTQPKLAGAALRGSAEAYATIVQSQQKDKHATLQEQGNRIAQDGFRRVEDAVRTAAASPDMIAAAPFN